MPSYQCLHCGFITSTPAEGQRCPECLRGGMVLQACADKKGPRMSRKRWLFTGGIVFAAVAAVALWLCFAKKNPEAVARLKEKLQASLGDDVSSKTFIVLLDQGESVSEFAEKASGNADRSEAKAKAIYTRLRRAFSEQQWQRWDFGLPRELPFQPPAQLVNTLHKPGKEALKPYPLEVALLMRNALVAVDVKAKLVEIIRWKQGDQPPDPSGRLGYFGVAVLQPEGNKLIMDPWGGRQSINAKQATWRLLDDGQSVAAALGQDAIYHLHQMQSQKSYRLLTQALRLDRRSPVLRCANALALAQSGSLPDALREMQAALQLRNDAARKVRYAEMMLAQGDTKQAEGLAGQALSETPNYGEAHALLALIYMASGRSDEAKKAIEASRTQLSKARHALLWARYYASIEKSEQALHYAAQASAAAPQNWRAQLQIAQLYKALDEEASMRKALATALKHMNDAQRTQTKAMLTAMFGIKGSDLNQANIADADAVTPNDNVQLTQPALIDPSSAPAITPTPQDAQEPTLMLGKPKDYRLRDADQQLRLNIDE